MYTFTCLQWTAASLMDNLTIDTYYYLMTFHTDIGKQADTTSNISFVVSGESADSSVRRLSDGKTQISFYVFIVIISLSFETDCDSNT